MNYRDPPRPVSKPRTIPANTVPMRAGKPPEKEARRIDPPRRAKSNMKAGQHPGGMPGGGTAAGATSYPGETKLYPVVKRMESLWVTCG
jgi:hypothetical protein